MGLTVVVVGVALELVVVLGVALELVVVVVVVVVGASLNAWRSS